jgi:type I restriction enzyme S subunit
MRFGDAANLRRENINPQNIIEDCPYVGLEHIGQENLHLTGLGSSRDVTSTKQKFVTGDVLFGKLRPYFRKVICADFSGVCSTDIWVVRPRSGINEKFLFYWMASWDFVNFVNNASEGTRMPRAKWEVAKKHEIPDFTTDDQKAIAYILGALDDKIELNQKMNQTLEEIAKAIFKSWFVDFDPVRAKAEGRPTGLPPEISDLFPDELVDSEIGEIPKEWDIKPAESLFDITIGRTPPRKESHWFTELETDVPWVSIRDMGDCGTFISKTSEYLTHDAVSKHRMQKLPVGSVLVSFKLTVGRVAITTQNMTTNEAIAHFPPSDAFPYPNFAYFYLKGFAYESLGSTSSIATAVNSKMIKAIPFIVAASDLTEKFEEIVAPMMDRIRLASEETHVLSELRDTLLPKLISGELRIPDAEKFLTEAGL